MSVMSDGKEMRFGCVLKTRLKRSDSTAGSRNESGSTFKTVGLVTEKARVPKVQRQKRKTQNIQFATAGRKAMLAAGNE